MPNKLGQRTSKQRADNDRRPPTTMMPHAAEPAVSAASAAAAATAVAVSKEKTKSEMRLAPSTGFLGSSRERE